jgi:hypothetical protein
MSTPAGTRRPRSSPSTQPASFPARLTTALPSGPAAVYRRRQPTRSQLYPLVQHHLETFLARAHADDEYGTGVPDWVEEDIRACLRCAILAHDFVRVRCAAEHLVAFSCKGHSACLTGGDAHYIQRLDQRRILRLYRRRGLLDPETVENMLTWQGSGGFSLDASVRIHGSARSGRERLLRYCALPPFSLERMSLEHGSTP